MSLLGSIPLPQHKDMFEGLMEQYLKQKEMEANAPLKRAQTEEALGKGEQARMTANFMRHYLGMGQSPETPPPNQGNGLPPIMNAPPQMAAMQPGDSMVYQGAEDNAAPAKLAPHGPFKAMENKGLINSPASEFIPNVAEQRRAGMPPSNKPSLMGEPAGQDQGQEITVKKGDESKYEFDKLAGMDMGGIKIPAEKTRVVDGVQYTTYPSGRETRMKVGPTYQEKQEILANNAGEKKTREINAKESANIESTVKEIIKSSHLLGNIHKLISDNKNLTGGWYGVPYFGEKAAKASSKKEVGEFVAASTALQAAYAKAQTSRPGIGMTDFFKGSKPDISNSEEFNKGMIKAHAQKQSDEFEDAKSDWESRNPGKEFHYKKPEILDKILRGKDAGTVRVLAPDGKTVITFPEDKVDAFLAEHPDHKRAT